jgi:hypothetical protein
MIKNSLAKLFGSTSRVKILKLFLLNPQEKYYIRQIARDLKLQLNSVRRELENLEKFGLLATGSDMIDLEEKEKKDDNSVEQFLLGPIKEEEKAKKGAISKTDKKYYCANTNFILHEEIKALILKSQVLYERDFVDKIKKAGKSKLLLFTGFFVNKNDSPVDIFLVGKFNKQALNKHIKELEEELGKEINFTLMDPVEFKYRRDITDVFLYNILEGKKLVIIDEYGLN